MQAPYVAHVGASENRGPQYSTLNSRILIIRTPKTGTPNFANSHVVHGHVVHQIDDLSWRVPPLAQHASRSLWT